MAKTQMAERFDAAAALVGKPNGGLSCVLNSCGPYQSLNPAGFRAATRIIYEVSGTKLVTRYVMPIYEIKIGKNHVKNPLEWKYIYISFYKTNTNHLRNRNFQLEPDPIYRHSISVH